MKKTLLRAMASALVLVLTITALVIPTTAKADTNYYVAGSFNGWKENNADYQMTKDGDVYKFVVTGLTASETPYEFKVTDGSWSNCWPASNYTFFLTADCDVTITFNPTTYDITATGSGILKDEVTYDYYIAGDFNGWNAKHPSYGMTKGSDGNYTFKLVDVAVGTHKFKVTNGTWDTAYPSSDYVFDVYSAGEITVTFNPTTFEITLTGDPLTSTTPIEKVFYVAGSFNDWKAGDEAYKMTKKDDTFTYTMTLDKGDHEFKVTDASWAASYPGSNYQLKLEEKSEVVITLNASNEVVVTSTPVAAPAPAPVVPETGDVATTSVIILLAGLCLLGFAAKRRFA